MQVHAALNRRTWKYLTQGITNTEGLWRTSTNKLGYGTHSLVVKSSVRQWQCESVGTSTYMTIFEMQILVARNRQTWKYLIWGIINTEGLWQTSTKYCRLISCIGKIHGQNGYPKIPLPQLDGFILTRHFPTTELSVPRDSAKDQLDCGRWMLHPEECMNHEPLSMIDAGTRKYSNRANLVNEQQDTRTR
jgi:hypothetical protein